MIKMSVCLLAFVCRVQTAVSQLLKCDIKYRKFESDRVFI